MGSVLCASCRARDIERDRYPVKLSKPELRKANRAPSRDDLVRHLSVAKTPSFSETLDYAKLRSQCRKNTTISAALGITQSCPIDRGTGGISGSVVEHISQLRGHKQLWPTSVLS